MINWMPPAFIFILGALALTFLKGRIKQAFFLLVPVIAFINLLSMPSAATEYTFDFIGYELIFGKVDQLSMVFAYVFVIAAFAGAIYALHLGGRSQHVAAFLYAGSALGVIFAGDLLTLFIFWELMALSSTYLVWARKTERSRVSGFTYLLIHLLGGLLLFAGIITQVSTTGSIAFNDLGLESTSSYLILLGFALNAAIPPLSAWLTDAYAEATVTGAVFLSAFTTKTAVYVIARAFPGVELLIWAGVIMAIYGAIFALITNDIRRILAYSIITQIGYMVAAIGIGTALALNGAVAHAFSHILYKGLLFMGAGAVLYVTGKSKLTELGGLYKYMPITFALYMVGALSISAFPFLSGFVTKSMIISSAAKQDMALVWVLLTVASAGTFLHTGLRLPYLTWFGNDSGLKAKEPPKNMLAAMGFLAALCVAVGVYPALLYNILPFEAKYVPYTADHIVWSLQFLLFAATGFFLFKKHFAAESYIVLDTDWFYRKGAKAFMWTVNNPLAVAGGWINKLAFDRIPSTVIWASRNPSAIIRMTGDRIMIIFSGHSRKEKIRKRIEREQDIYPGDIIKHWPIGSTVLWVTIFLLAYLLIYYLTSDAATIR